MSIPATFTVKATYTDQTGNAQTQTLQLVLGSTGVAVQAVTTVDIYYFHLPYFIINNSATVITLSSTGTFTGSPVYAFGAILEQLV